MRPSFAILMPGYTALRLAQFAMDILKRLSVRRELFHLDQRRTK
ncbi:hypothetical protein QIT82_gp86 [Pseudomonas phage psageK9]|uniref:Uncharacterized protein n=1 Tax=Pseudomonas phage psageK9 TaxID=2875722 RepID=A0AAE9BT28_9CAUD|nr:hypothetical protein QIT82_gp86 [Pseudomonas phage psageK9]UAW53956.1 hypothetical protein psageK9_86 [Pseudomonas phage psageK9]